MKKYVAMITQFFIWSGFTVVEWLSGDDRILAKATLFAVFFYLAFLLGKMIVQSNKVAIVVTVASLAVYGGIYLSLDLLQHSTFL
ncbi:hypothetical protein ACFSCZ_03140 [Siminovitchia sediminis]|uniref:Uncharacterized protein n=1 Tax=Siminovitchia sediminis TaxID=1274353 RepID=A0ABW4KFB3_9BACI